MNGDFPRPSLPVGTLTFLFTDIEGSTHLWEQSADAMRVAMARHDALIESCVAQNSGAIVRPRGEGDSRFAVFPCARDAIVAAAAIQRAIFAEEWTTPLPLRVRVALHTGEADLRDGDYYGTAVNRCARLRGAAHGGQTLVSQITYDLVHNLLPTEITLRDLGKHRLKDLKTLEHIYQLVIEGLPAEFPRLETLAASSTNLPIQLTSFVGREKEMTYVKEILSTTRLLTLIGVGGSGKTRLALQVAGDVIERFPNGVWLVELASLSDPLLVTEQVASVFGLREFSDYPALNIVRDYLRSKKVLLILDNCEHLIQAVAQLSQALLNACPDLTILATSREPMDIIGESTFRVPALAVPDLTDVVSGGDYIQSAATCESIQLFLERATVIQPDFHLTLDNVAAVAQICQRLDGMPLAIELAAARVNTLSVKQIAERLDDRFRLLTGGSRTALPRHQRLRTCIDWSYDLLSESERSLLRRLSVFVGSWSLQAAEHVCAGDGIEQADILDLSNYLVNKSLVIVQLHADETRYQMLDTIREYAREKMVESGDAQRMRHCHLEYFMTLAEKAGIQLRTREQLIGLELLKLEYDNLRAALDWATQGDDSETGLRLASALAWFWCLRGDLNEGRDLLERMLKIDATLHSPSSSARAKVLNSAAYIAWRQGAYDRAAILSAQSQALCEELGDRLGLAWSMYNQGLIAQFQGDLDRAIAIFEQCQSSFRESNHTWGIAMSLDSLGEIWCSHGDSDRAAMAFEGSLALFRETGDRWGIAHVLCNLGVTESFRGNSQYATALLEEGLELYRELGDKAGMAYALHNLGNVARLIGDYARAVTLIEEGLTLRRELGNPRGIAASLGQLGKIALMQDKPESATTLLKESLNLVKALGDRLGIAVSFSHLGNLAIRQGQFSRAARLFGAADGLRQIIGAPLPKTERADFERDLYLIRSRMGEAEFEQGWSVGREMALERAIAYALDGIEETCLQITIEPNYKSRAMEYAHQGAME